jgi:hypothetical protein
MTQTSIASNIHQALDIELHFLAEIAFNSAVILDDLPNPSGLFFRKGTHLSIDTHFRLLTNFRGTSLTDAIDIG